MTVEAVARENRQDVCFEDRWFFRLRGHNDRGRHNHGPEPEEAVPPSGEVGRGSGRVGSSCSDEIETHREPNYPLWPLEADSPGG